MGKLGVYRRILRSLKARTNQDNVTDLPTEDSKPSAGISKAHKAANTKEMEG